MIGIGSIVGNYRVVRLLGSGAMGSVYLAEHPQIGKKVALKVIHAELAENAEMISRFFNEARAVTQIGHPNIVEVIDFGQTPEGDSFIIMELLEGQGLGDRLKEQPMLPVDEAVHVAAQIADGLEASHRRGIIHRDLKPDNVFLVERDGDPRFVKILDFGLAKLTQGGGAISHKTRAGAVLGTPHYMAPEQCEGKPDIDHRVDIYALGCLMYHMLCGQVPFPGEGFGEVLVRHLREPPVVPSKRNPAVPRAVEAIVLHALAKRKEFRFQSMQEMARALRDPERHQRELSGEGPMMTTAEIELARLPTGAGGGQATLIAQPVPAEAAASGPKQQATVQIPAANMEARPRTAIAAVPAAITGRMVPVRHPRRWTSAPALAGLTVGGLLVLGLGVYGVHQLTRSSSPEPRPIVTEAPRPELPERVPPEGTGAQVQPPPSKELQPVAAQPVAAAEAEPEPVLLKPPTRDPPEVAAAPEARRTEHARAAGDTAPRAPAEKAVPKPHAERATSHTAREPATRRPAAAAQPSSAVKPATSDDLLTPPF